MSDSKPQPVAVSRPTSKRAGRADDRSDRSRSDHGREREIPTIPTTVVYDSMDRDDRSRSAYNVKRGKSSSEFVDCDSGQEEYHDCEEATTLKRKDISVIEQPTGDDPEFLQRSLCMLQRSFKGIIYFGTSYCCWFLEVCAGKAILTQAVRYVGLSAMEPVDLSTGWDLTLRLHVIELKQLIKRSRPLFTHLSPVCRIFSTAYNPSDPDFASTEEYLSDMKLAWNIASISEYILELYLFVAIESTLRGSMYKLACYVKLQRRAGMFFVDLNRCMSGYRHAVTGQLVWKGHRLLTNAPWLMSLGVLCDGSHSHTPLIYKHAKASQEYDWNMCVDYAMQLKSAPKWLKLMHSRLPITLPSQGYKKVSSLSMTRHWPDFPETYLVDELDTSRLTHVVFEEDLAGGVIAPLRADPERADEQKLKEMEEEFAMLIKWITTQKTPVDRVDYSYRENGEELYLVHFRDEITDIRDFKEKKTIQFQAYGKHHVLKYGRDKAAGMAYACFIASRIEDPQLKYGCGPVNPATQFHGDDRHEFYVYELSDFLRLSTRPSFDPVSVTFAPGSAFCWNCAEQYKCGEYKQYRCLGHTVAADHDDPRKIVWADDSAGAIRDQTESIFLSIKTQVKDAEGPRIGKVLSCGVVFGTFHEMLPQHEKLTEWVIGFYWTHCNSPMTGFDLFRNCQRIETPEETHLVLWDSRNNQAVALKQADGEFQEPERYLQVIGAGRYEFKEFCSGIVFSHSSRDQCKGHTDELEQRGFPIPQSLRVSGLDGALTKLQLERNRLPAMYRVGHDTNAEFYLLLLGASRLSLDGGDSVLPSFTNEEHKENLYSDLALMILTFSENTEKFMLTDRSVQPFRERFTLEIQGILIHPLNNQYSMLQYSTPTKDEGLKWEEVFFRLTLAWRGVPVLDARPLEFLLEKFEVAGKAIAGPAHATTGLTGDSLFGCTIFFGAERSDEPVAVSRSTSTLDFVEVKGEDIKEDIKAGRAPRTNQFSAPELKELSRRTGISIDRFSEALGNLDLYRLKDGVMQKTQYVKTHSSYNFLTVIPDGAWRTVEFNGESRRLTLRRYIVLIYHCAALTPQGSGGLI